MLSYYKSSLILLFTKVHELNKFPRNFALCFEIQETLIRKITYVEQKIRKLKSKVELDRKSLRTKRKTPLTKGESTFLKNEIEVVRYKIGEYQYLIYIYKCIGDAIAYTYINKWDIKPMSMKESPGFISGKKGSRLERKVFRSSYEFKQPIILNDLTNCLRYGDITVPKDGTFLLIEMKSGKKKNLDNRSKKQIEKLENIGNYFINDYTQNLYNKQGNFFRVDMFSEEKSCVKKLNKIIENALDKGFSYSKIEDGLFCFATTNYSKEMISKVIPDERHSDEMFATLINLSNFKGYYPIILTIKNPLAVYKFFQDSLSILVFIDMKLLKKKLDEVEIIAEFTNDDYCLKLTHKKAKNPEAEYQKYSMHFFNRIFNEFLSLEWFIDEISQGFKNLPEIDKFIAKRKLLQENL
jgi:hypothetical protein